MANDLNSVILVGRLTRDMESRTTNSGKTVGSFSLAVGGFKKDETSFFDCQVWGKTAENLAQYLLKGKQIAISGSLIQQRWEQDGNKRSKVVVNCQNIQLLGGKSDSGDSQQSQQKRPPQQRQQNKPQQRQGPEGFDDDILF